MKHFPSIHAVPYADLEITDQEILESIAEKWCVLDIKKRTDGFVHSVYEIKSTQAILFAKIRRNSFASNASININPHDIINEKIALDHIRARLGDVVPEVLDFVPEYATLLLSDVQNGNPSLDTLIHERSWEFLPAAAKTIGRFHRTYQGEVIPIRKTDEETFYHNNLYYRLGFLDLPEIDHLVQKLYNQPRQLIHGDLSPRNIIYAKDEDKIRIFDLETVHMGNALFDLAFFESHLVMEIFPEGLELLDKINIFRRNYEHEGWTEDEDLEIRLVFALMLYRLKSSFKYTPSKGLSAQEMNDFACMVVNSYVLWTWNNICNLMS